MDNLIRTLRNQIYSLRKGVIMGFTMNKGLLSDNIIDESTKKTASDDKSSSFKFNVEDDNKISIDFEGDTLKDLRTLKDNLHNADTEQDVVRVALEILALANGKDIVVEGQGKRWRIKDLWIK
jgi:hypothetical protein